MNTVKFKKFYVNNMVCVFCNSKCNNNMYYKVKQKLHGTVVSGYPGYINNKYYYKSELTDRFKSLKYSDKCFCRKFEHVRSCLNYERIYLKNKNTYICKNCYSKQANNIKISEIKNKFRCRI